MVVYIHRRETDNKPFYVGVSKKTIRPYDFGNRSPLWKRIAKIHGVIVEIYTRDIDKETAYKTEAHLIDIYSDTVVNINGNVYNKPKKYK